MEVLRSYAMQFVGTPYKWGGANPMEGLDCSGLVQILLASAGLDFPGDQTAQGLYDVFEKNGEWNSYQCGSLVFYGKDALHVTHVAMMLDQYRIIEAGGGGSKVVDIASATANSSYVRVRLWNYRPDIVGVIRPNYKTIGEL